MAYISLLTLLLSISTWATLPKMLTKIPLDTIRFISSDGKVTLYQKNSGELARATNFNSEDILKLADYTHYIVNTIKGSSYLGIEADPTFFSNDDALKNHELYLLKRSETKAVKVAEGKDLKLHLGGVFFSYYQPRSKKIYLQATSSKTPADTISIANRINPYFTPQLAMIDANTVLYTDLNSEGLSGLLYYDRSTKMVKTLFKSAERGTRIEFCQFKDQIIIGEFTYPSVKLPSKIYQMNGNGNIMTNKITSLYSSENSDPGHLTCSENKVYFIKDIAANGPTNNRITEVVSLDVKTQGISLISNLKKAFQIIDMDGRILIPYGNEYYVIEGQNDAKSDSLEKKGKNK